jgi:diguanylate cyclase (GGDEF)-like protein
MSSGGISHDPDPWDEEESTLTSKMTEVLSAKMAPRTRDRATLTMVTGPDTGKVYSLEEVTTLGRGRECTIRIEDGSVSRVHARISRGSPTERFLVEDLGSRNGTFVDGYRIKRHSLNDGDRIQVGPSVHLRFSITDDVEEGLLRRLYESSVRDPLTGAFNRKHFNERMTSEIAYSVRHKTALSLLMFDIDHFKRVNDDYGHLAGDKVLRSLAGLVARTIRTEDIFARYGGEEFTVIARGIDTRGSLALAERIRGIIIASRFEFEGQNIPVTVSIGVATMACCSGEPTAEDFIAIADKRLYQAKQTGRNRVVGP